MNAHLIRKCFLIPFLLCACQGMEVSSSSFAVSSSSSSSLVQAEYAFDVYHLSLIVGDSYRIRFTKDGQEVRGAIWSSGNEEVATVSSVGTIFARGAGVTHVKATIDDESLLCEVSVSPKKAEPAGEIYLHFRETSLTLYAGDTYRVTPVLQEDEGGEEVAFEAVSSNDSVAILDLQSWQVHALTKGDAVITVTARKGSAKATASISIKVYEK